MKKFIFYVIVIIAIFILVDWAIGEFNAWSGQMMDRIFEPLNY
jgi:DNA-binding transcriptional regulator of glucitol operon